MKFRVIDKLTGKEADPYEIALHEEWAKGLCYCDMDGFALLEDGTLLLVDECGKFEYCDADRFEVVFEDERPHGEWKYDAGSGQFICSECEGGVNMPTLMGEPLYKWCPWCGSDNRKREGDQE